METRCYQERPLAFTRSVAGLAAGRATDVGFGVVVRLWSTGIRLAVVCNVQGPGGDASETGGQHSTREDEACVRRACGAFDVMT